MLNLHTILKKSIQESPLWHEKCNINKMEDYVYDKFITFCIDMCTQWIFVNIQRFWAILQPTSNSLCLSHFIKGFLVSYFVKGSIMSQFLEKCISYFCHIFVKESMLCLILHFAKVCISACDTTLCQKRAQSLCVTSHSV